MTSVIVSSIRAERVFPVPDILLNRIFDTEATNMAIPITKTEAPDSLINCTSFV